MTRLAQPQDGSDAFSRQIHTVVVPVMTLTVGTESTTIDLSTATPQRDPRRDQLGHRQPWRDRRPSLNVGGGNQRLILTAEESGYDSRVQLSFGGHRRRHLQLCDHQPGQPGATLTDLMELDARTALTGST